MTGSITTVGPESATWSREGSWSVDATEMV